ncbi:MAG: nicotinate-nucleotide--dimethylbenzimidazole phosphoribosyltransferase [Desulforhopalus sp.]|nr:nicotinate-nucleotide--dimethylbenzimidazole phosphoribosyltransferase [Desulforhopalus sp.]
MQLVLTECGTMQYRESVASPAVGEGQILLKVACCAICRTDAKMWRQGHRDLALPRVLGHEIAGVDPDTGRLYAVWPGQSCGTCRYCTSGRENLCEEMRIIGFHSDGGFARTVVVPRESLIAAEENADPRILTFAEPVACVFNGLSGRQPAAGERVIIYGGGVVGMIAALIVREMGCPVTVIERSAEKIARLKALAEQNRIDLVKDTTAADYDLAINCCASPIAFSLCITKLRKGGRLVYFSGLDKNQEIGTNLLNLIHYKELEVFGSYGPKRADMVHAVGFCARQSNTLIGLIEGVIHPSEVESVLPGILAGTALKYVVDFSLPGAQAVTPSAAGEKVRQSMGRTTVSPFLDGLIARVKQPSITIRHQAQKKVDLKTKPLGALGRIEQLAVRLCAMQNTLEPRVDCRRMFVFAGDHGVVEEGVSAFPAKVTVQMVENFLGGGAAINVFSRHYGIDLAVVDMGVNGDFADHPLLIKQKVAYGTNNFAVQPAMSRDQAIQAIENGARAFLAKNLQGPCQLAGFGEMGIGNSSSATAIICGASGLPAAEVAGRGTGVDDRGLARKVEVIDRALALHRLDPADGLGLLAAVGGYELAGICGAVIAAASEGCCVVLDGIISTAAGLLAHILCPGVGEYLVAGHKSVEAGQKIALQLMGLEPVVDLDLRLGEGTGAAITMNLVDLSCRMMREMASFAEAGVDSGSLQP